MIKNSLFNALIALSGPLINLISIPIAAKALGANSFGEASVAISFASYFSIVSTLGLAVYGTRELAATKTNREKSTVLFSELLFLSVCASVSAAIIYSLIASLVFASPIKIIVIGALSLTLNFINIEWLYYAREKYKIVAYATILGRLVSLSLVYIFVNNDGDTFKYVAILLTASLLPNLLIFFEYRQYTSIAIKDVKPFRHIKSIGYFFSIRVFSSVYSVLDIVIVGLFSGGTVAGFYSIAIRVARIVASVLCSITSVAMPRASALYLNNEKDKYEKLLVNTLITTIILSSVAFSFTLLFSDKVVFYLGGPEFKSASMSLGILSFMVPIVALSNFLGMQILYPNKNEKGVLISLGIGAIIYIILSPLLVISFGLLGASFAALLSESSILIFQIHLTKKYIKKIIIDGGNRLMKLTILTFLYCIFSISLYFVMNDKDMMRVFGVTIFLFIIYVIGLIAIKEPMINYKNIKANI